MCYNTSYITVVIELMKSKDVFGASLKLESPFSVVAMTSYGLRAFLFARKISGFKLSFPDSLSRVDKKSKHKKQALLAPATCTMRNGLHKRVMAFFASCEHFRYSKRFDCWNENKSILTLYMGGDLGHGERCSNVYNKIMESKMKKHTYTFEVETIEAGQRQAYGDSYYHFKVTSRHPMDVVKGFCMGALRPSYKKEDMPNPFAGELKLFKKITNNNESFLDNNEETYEYKMESTYTG